MKKTSLKIKIISGMLCMGLVFTQGSLTFAAENDNGNAKINLASNVDIKVPMDMEKGNQDRQVAMNAVLENVIKQSVVDGIITKSEEGKVLEYINTKYRKKCKNGKCDGAKGGLFTDLVTEGILTKEKSQALREKMHLKTTELRNENIQKGLNTLVTSKVLTEAQCAKVKEAIMAREVERRDNYTKMKDMKESQRKEYMKKIKKNQVDPMKVLLDNKIITKEQEKEIQKVLPQYHKHKHGYRGLKED